MGEVRACVYFSVIFLCFQISSAKPFFGDRFWCDLLCTEDDGLTTLSSEADYFDSWCDDCPTRRPRPVTTPMPPAFANPALPMPPGIPPPPGVPAPPGFPAPGPPINIMMNPPQNGGGINFSMVPDANRGWNFFWNPWGGGGSPSQPPNATPATVSPSATQAAPAAAAATPAPAAAAPPAAPAATAAPAAPDAPATTVAPPAARK